MLRSLGRVVQRAVAAPRDRRFTGASRDLRGRLVDPCKCLSVHGSMLAHAVGGVHAAARQCPLLPEEGRSEAQGVGHDLSMAST